MQDLVRSYEIADYDEFINHQIEKKYEEAGRLEGPEHILVQFFIEELVEALDEYLTHILPGVDIAQLVTCKWLNDTDVILGVLND